MKRILIIAITIIVFCIVVPAPAFAQNTADVNARIEELKAKIGELQGKENSLSKEIGLINSDIDLTGYRIEAIRLAVDKLSIEIDELAGEIGRLDTQMTKRSALVLHRIPEAYKRLRVPDVGVVLLSANIADAVTRMKYIERVQKDDANNLLKLKATQVNFEERKNQREKKRQQQQALKDQLEEQNRILDRQKKAKQAILTETKNSEVVYQKLLTQAYAEKQAIESAIQNGISVGPVKKGDPIALVGNTGYPGCSTGAHLHFEVRRGGSWVNAEDYLTPRVVDDQQNGGSQTIGRGSWDWPLDGGVVVTQRYGKTPYSWRYTYSGGIHTGIDMISNSTIVIRAPKDGTLYTASEACGSGSVIKIKYIDHGDGTTSFYLHVQ